jgi:putative transposase
LLRARKVISRNKRKSTSYDNAPIESFYKTLKRKLIDGERFESPSEVKQEIFKYIETCYNAKRGIRR